MVEDKPSNTGPSVNPDENRTPDPRLLEEVYDQLRALAGSYLRRERPDHTLQATALVHEAYLRISENTGAEWQSPAHFFAFAAETIRRVLVDHARKHNALKRGGDRQRVELAPSVSSNNDGLAVDVLDLNAALEDLAKTDAQAARTVELRYFGGLTMDEIATVLEVSPRTVTNHWAFGKAWLHKRLKHTATQ
jgi:RNA polymerase sigma factor (TIGR02999 family)